MTLNCKIHDTGHPSHGMSLGFHTDLFEFHGEMCEIEIVPLEKEVWEEQRWPKHTTIRQDPEPIVAPPTYKGYHLVYFDQQANQGCTIGRCPRVEVFHGWLCRVSLGKVAIEQIPSVAISDILKAP